ncbi:MAG: exodeoxyribonuclease VII small subunit [Planctomycetaceae bacterium]|nr:exodeoxyribonuclease VII small subunit [Planctomycetaceae bacterium]
MVAKKKVAKTKQPSFEKSLEELESIVAKLESGKLGLDESLQQYESGVKHLKSCYSLLTSAERRIALVSGVDSEGHPQTESFDEGGEDSLVQKGASRSRRRSAPSPGRKSRSDMDGTSSLF